MPPSGAGPAQSAASFAWQRAPPCRPALRHPDPRLLPPPLPTPGLHGHTRTWVMHSTLNRVRTAASFLRTKTFDSHLRCFTAWRLVMTWLVGSQLLAAARVVAGQTCELQALSIGQEVLGRPGRGCTASGRQLHRARHSCGGRCSDDGFAIDAHPAPLLAACKQLFPQPLSLCMLSRPMKPGNPASTVSPCSRCCCCKLPP